MRPLAPGTHRQGGVDPTYKDGSALETHPGRGSASKSFSVRFFIVLESFCAFSSIFLCFGEFLRVFACFSALGMPLGALGALLGALGTLLGRSWGALGALLGALGRSWGALEALLERSWKLLGRSWGALGQKYEKKSRGLRNFRCFREGFWKGFGHLERPCKEPEFT